MSNEMRAILAAVLYHEREKVGPPDAAFDLSVAAFMDRLDARAAGDTPQTGDAP
jgi:hypothetical protein